MAPRPLLAALSLLLACSEPEPAPLPPPPPSEPLPLVVYPALFIREDEPLRLLQDSDPVQLWNATQGGHVALIGAQIEGVDGDTIELRARISDPETGALLAEESRTVLVKPVPGDSTRKQTDIRTRSQVTHIPLCPNYEPTPVVDRTYRLDVRVDELYVSPPRRGSATLLVRTACDELTEEPARCRCECEADYTLGKCQ